MPIRIKVRKAPSLETSSQTQEQVQPKKKMEYIRLDNCFQCPKCPFTCSLENQSTMFYHMKTHENFLPYKCKHCNERYLQKSLLDFHIAARHTSDVKKIQCPCTNCKFEDLRKGNVVIHFNRIHLADLIADIKMPSNEEKCVATCKTCNESFKNMTGFLYHASNCITVPENHAMFSAWNQIQTAGKVGA
jgi:hypothetical protein